MGDNPKQVTVYGWLSFPTLTAAEAYALSLKGSYPAADAASAAPHFQVLLPESQKEKLVSHFTAAFLPYCVEQEKAGQKKDALSAAEVKKLIEGLEDLENQVYNTPLKPVHEKTAPLVPDAVATLKVIGPKGGDFVQSAIVRSEDDLRVNDGSLLVFPVIRPITETNFQLYPGCVVAVTLNLYAYHNGKHPGFSAGASTVVFKADGERIGGGSAVDEDEIFAD